MYSNSGVQQYRETDISSMSREKMIVLLYEKVVMDLESAKKALIEENRAEFAKKINHSQRIVSELRSALDHELGGEIAINLEALYSFMFHEHLEILLDRDPVHIDNCLKVIEPLLEAWRQIPTGTGDKAATDVIRQSQGRHPGPDSANHSDGSNPAQPANDGQGQGLKTSLLSVSA